MILRIFSIMYYIHLLIAFFSSLALIILFPQLHHKISITLVLIIIYGFMLVWLALFNIFFVVSSMFMQIIHKQSCAVWCNRMIAKAIIMIFPVMFLICLMNQNFMDILWVKIFMGYLLVFSLLLILYEFYACTWGHHQQPNYLYEDNDLAPHFDEVWSIRNQFFQNRILSQSTNLNR